MAQVPSEQSRRNHVWRTRAQHDAVVVDEAQARARLRESKFESTYLEWAKELRLRAYIEMREPPL